MSSSAGITSSDVIHVHVPISMGYIIRCPRSCRHQHGLHHQILSTFMSSSALITPLCPCPHQHWLHHQILSTFMSSSALITPLCPCPHQHWLHHQMLSTFMSSSTWITSSDIVHVHVLISTDNTTMSMSSSALITSSDVVHVHVLIRTQVGDTDKRAARGGSLGIRFSGTGPWKYEQSCQPHTSDLATTPCILRQVQVNF